MVQRREFLKAAGALAVSAVSTRRLLAQNIAPEAIQFASPSIDAQLIANAPEFISLNIDGLGKGRRGANIVSNTSGGGYQSSVSTSGSTRRIEYRVNQAGPSGAPAWTVELAPNRITLTSQWSPEYQPTRFTFRFNLNSVHSTVLGLFQNDGLLATPALMHFPGQGSMRLTSSVPDFALTYVSNRPQQTATLTLPGATFEHQRIVYTLDVTAIYPNSPASKTNASTPSAATGSTPSNSIRNCRRSPTTRPATAAHSATTSSQTSRRSRPRSHQASPHSTSCARHSTACSPVAGPTAFLQFLIAPASTPTPIRR